MKVLHFNKAALPGSYGGIEQFIDTLCGASSSLGVENTVLTLSKKPRHDPIEMKGYNVYQVQQHLFFASTGFSLSAFGRFKKLVRQADIIHYHFPNPFADILHISSRIRKPTILTYHSDIVKQKHLLHVYRPLMRYFLDSVDHIVATSQNYFESSSVLQDYARKVSIIPIGLAQESSPKVDKARVSYWRQRLRKHFFLFIGAMRYYKGLQFALEAIAGTEINLVVAGGGGIEKELKKQASSLKLDNVEFLGFINNEDKDALLSLCSGFVFPSHLRSEAFGIALIEASIFGKPMITCEIGTGTSYVNKADETGLVVAPASSQELRDAMRYLINNPKVASRMGVNAKKRAEKLFSAEKLAQSYYERYKQLNERRN